MSSQCQPKYLCRRVIYELRRHGLGRHHIPPDFFSSRLYRDVLDSLDVAKIPKTSATERDQWRNIVNAADRLTGLWRHWSCYPRELPINKSQAR